MAPYAISGVASSTPVELLSAIILLPLEATYTRPFPAIGAFSVEPPVVM